MPFEVPEGWVWIRVGDCGDVVTGTTPSKDNKEYYGGEIPFYKPTDLDQGEYTLYASDNLSDLGFKQCRQLPCNSILVTCIGATIGKTGIIKSQGACNQQINAIVPRDFLNYQYLYYVCVSSYMQNIIRDNASSTTLPILNKSKFSELLIPLPPINEQHRIVSAIKSIITVIDDLDREQFQFRNQIQKIKNIILDLALSGNLVSQDITEEPAIELLRRINPNYKPCDNRHYENLPDSWEICRLKDIFNITMGQSPDGETINSTSGIEFHQGKINFTDRYLSESGIFTTAPTKIALPDSLLLCVRAPVGVVNITKRKICIGRGLCSLHPKYDIDCLFWLYVLDHYKHYFEENATGTTFKAISGDVIKNLVIPFPPIAEQHRILAKINELYRTLDRIAVEL